MMVRCRHFLRDCQSETDGVGMQISEPEAIMWGGGEWPSLENMQGTILNRAILRYSAHVVHDKYNSPPPQ